MQGRYCKKSLAILTARPCWIGEDGNVPSFRQRDLVARVQFWSGNTGIDLVFDLPLVEYLSTVGKFADDTAFFAHTVKRRKAHTF
jgi:hypothetical protein